MIGLYNEPVNLTIMMRRVSLIVAAVHLVLALILGGLIWVFVTALVSTIALALIWFAEEIGEYTGGFHRIGRPYITKKSPGVLVALFGWLLLVLPIILFALKLTQKN